MKPMYLVTPCLVAASLIGGAVAVAGQDTVPRVGRPIVLPTRFTDDRVFVRPVTESGDTLEFYTDTGGGAIIIYPHAVTRLKLPLDSADFNGRRMPGTPLPRFRPTAWIPGGQHAYATRALVLALNEEAGALAAEMNPQSTGFLGRPWFADRVWTWDFAARQLLLRAPGDVPRVAPRHRVPLAFQTNAAGQRTSHYPRIRVEVDGDTLDLLFDSGATVSLSDSARAQMGPGGTNRAGSFINATVFDRWKARHPDWLVIPGGDRFAAGGEAMIRVPTLSVGCMATGPVWFARRADANFAAMSRQMDRSVVGALGNSALKYFRVTVDYPNAVAIFERPRTARRGR